MYRLVSLGFVACVATACGGGNGESGTTTRAKTLAVEDYATLTKTTMEPKHLKPATEDELLNHLLNGIRMNVYVYEGGGELPIPLATAAPEAGTTVTRSEDSDTSLSDSTGGGFSTTNVHVNGVDEADYIKYDGEHIYLSTESQYQEDAGWTTPSIRILATDPGNAGVSEVATIPSDDTSWGAASALYLLSDGTQTSDLVSLRSQWSYFALPMASSVIEGDYLTIHNEAIQVNGYDVTSPSTPEKSFSIEIDGYLQSSRKVDNMLYLVARFSPNIPTIRFYVDDEEAEENEARIAALTLDDLLPKIRIDEGEAQNLVSASDCLLPLDLTDKHGYASLTTLIAIDLSTHSLSSAKCLNANVGGIYATRSTLYIGGSHYISWNDHSSYTTIHKFTLGENINYRSTGVVPGWLGWQDPSFRMSEHEGYFRIVTTERPDGWSGDPVHRLSVLQDDPSSDDMRVVAELPNETEPTPIGKPGEDLYAVRFVGDRAYAVTFERIDPLYVLDLSEAEAPRLAGELEVPGFSTYLHPIDDNYLLGLGRDADDTGRANGIKLSLYDISNIDAPSEINNLTYGAAGTWSAALYDLRALSFLRTSNDQLRLTVPISLRDSDYRWQEDALHLFEVNGLSDNTADLSLVGKMTSEVRSEEMQWPSWSGVDRGILHNEAVYYAHGNEIWSGFWSSPSSATGPH